MAVYTDIDLSFRKHPVSKDIIKKTDVDAVKQSLRVLFQNGAFSSPFDPEFGIGIDFMLFEQLTPPMIGILEKKITEKIFQYEPRCRIDSLSITEDDNNSLSIELAFHVIGNALQQNFNYKLSRVR